MRTTGALLCLLLIIPLGGWLYRAKPLAKTKLLVPTFAESLDRAWGLYEAGKYKDAARVYSQGYKSATALREVGAAARFLHGIGNCHFAWRQYQQALECYLTARRMFESIGDISSVDVLDGNLSSLYSQLGEFDAAIEIAKRALARQPAFGEKSYRARLLILLANLNARQGRIDEAQALFREGILEAYRFDDPELISTGWDKLGAELLLRKQLRQSEEALLEAYRIRKLNHLPRLGSSYRNLGLLRLEQGDLRSASTLLEASLVEAKSGREMMPQWRFYQARGRLRLAEGKLASAHADFRLALDLARNYRLAVPASDATRVSVEEFLQELYSSFAETGNRLYFKNANADLARETFEALEENRAGSLAARLSERDQFRRKLPPAYWQLLSQLEAAESAALLDTSDGLRYTMRRLRGSLIELEARAGDHGSCAGANLLERVQVSLDSSTALLSIHLAEPQSSLWAVSHSGISLYALPGRATISAQAILFRQAVLTGDADAEKLGAELYRMLFGELGRQYQDKTHWLLSLDQRLFDVPFTALVTGSGRHSAYLIERHSLRVISSAAILANHSHRATRLAREFVGVGDAIYNTADARWRTPLFRFDWPWLANAADSVRFGLTRLAGSGREIEACARAWNGASVLLRGREASKENVRRAMASRPGVLHFATHILQGQQRTTDAFIALSLSDSGGEQLLGPAEISGWSTDADLVVLSGCSSGIAEARPGAGLMGMTRAWLMAGARSVIVTQWPAPDDVGVFFRRFYQQFEAAPGRDPADALRSAQIETLRSEGWRSKPKFWAAYFALGNY